MRILCMGISQAALRLPKARQVHHGGDSHTYQQICTDRSGIENGSRVRVESYMLRMARQLQDIFSLTLERTDYSGYMGNCPSSCGTYFSITAQRSKLIGSVMHAPRNAFNAPGPVMKLLTTGMIRSCRMFL